MGGCLYRSYLSVSSACPALSGLPSCGTGVSNKCAVCDLDTNVTNKVDSFKCTECGAVVHAKCAGANSNKRR